MTNKKNRKKSNKVHIVLKSKKNRINKKWKNLTITIIKISSKETNF